MILRRRLLPLAARAVIVDCQFSPDIEEGKR
jgi:hypothetical protein